MTESVGKLVKTDNQPKQLNSPLLEDGPIDTSTPKLHTESDSESRPELVQPRLESGLGVSLEPVKSTEVDEAGRALEALEFSATSRALTLETTPLLPSITQDLESGDYEPIYMQKKTLKEFGWSVFTFLVVLLLCCIVVAGLVVRNIERLLDAAITPTIEAVSILNVTDSGISAHVLGNITVNYGKIDNWVYRSALQLSGLLIGTVYVSSRETVQVSVSGPEFDRVHLIDILPPELPIDLVNKRVSPIDFISDTRFAESGLQTVVDSFLSHQNEEIELEMEILLSPSVTARWIHFKGSAITLTRELIILPNDTHVPVNITDMSTEFGKNYVSLAIAVSLPPLPVEYTVKPIEWDVMLLDCERVPTLLGIWTSDTINLKPDFPTEVKLFGSVSEIPAKLLQSCPDGMSPFNRFTQEIFQENNIHVWVSATKSATNKDNLMPWLYKILTLALIEVNTLIPDNANEIPGLLEDIISEPNISRLGIVIPHTSSLSPLRLNVDLDVSANVNFPGKNKGLEAVASEIISTLNVLTPKGNDLVLLIMTTGGSVDLATICSHKCSSTVECQLTNATVEILSPKHVGEAINRVLDGLAPSLFLYIAELHHAFLDVGFFSTELKNLTIGRTKSVQTDKEMVGTSNNQTFLNWLIENANILIAQLVYVSSSADKLAVLVEFDATNPLNASFSAQDIVTFDYFYNGTQKGNFFMENLKVDKTDERQSFSANVVLKNTAYGEKDDLLSRIVSGLPVALDMKGTPSEEGIGSLLQHVHARQVKIPPLNFNNGDGKGLLMVSDDKEKPVRHSPFLISTTIHIWTSDIELTVFNPLANVEIAVRILSCKALYEDELLAHIEMSELILVPPGVYKTPRIPVQISKGLGADILKKAINGELLVEVFADLNVLVGRFSTDVGYHGQGLTATVRL